MTHTFATCLFASALIAGGAAACGGASSTFTSGDQPSTAEPMAPAEPAGPTSEPDSEHCSGPFQHSRSWAEMATQAEAMLALVRQHDAQAYFFEGVETMLPFGFLTVSARGVIEDASPATVLAHLGEVFGLVASDFVVETRNLDASTLQVQVVRARVGSHAFGLPSHAAVALTMQQQANAWQYDSVTLYPAVLFATAADAERIAACTANAAPTPTAPALTHSYEGLEFDNCEQVGAYAYQPNAADTVALSPGIQWQLAEVAPAASRYAWASYREGSLSVNAANYWERVAYADCSCHDVGFDLVVQPVTGAVLRYRPGLECVVC